MNYKEAGVNIDEANASVKSIKGLVKKTFSPAVISDIGAFGAMYDGRFPEYKEPVLISSADGVGTKMIIAEQADWFENAGADIVNHSVNDILAVGAKPLYFLDYIGAGKIEKKKVELVIASMADACMQNGLSLIGGELAEMSEVYNFTHYDVVGFIVGIAEKDEIIKGSGIKDGDVLIGLPSNGFHTNGFTLVRRILEETATDIMKPLENGGEPLYKLLLTPHRSYFKEVYPLVKAKLLSGIAHITGGGFYDNIERILPDGIKVEIYKDSWQVPKLFSKIVEIGEVKENDAYRTFNMGIGMVLFSDKASSEKIIEAFISRGIEHKIIGRAFSGDKSVVLK